MMKTYLLLLLSCTLLTCRQEPDQTATLAQLPISVRPGYGPFHPGFSPIGAERKDDPLWGKTYPAVNGIPKHWTGVVKSRIWLNTHQFVYQNFVAGNISAANYSYLQKAWRWEPDSNKLSKKPIRCYVCVVRGFDETRNKWAVMLDTNNNLDFGDETPIYPESIDNKNPYAYKNPQVIHYDVYRRGSVVEAQLPMVVKTIGTDFVYNFPQYATATFTQANKKIELLISSGFTRPDYEVTMITLASAVSGSEKADPEQLIDIGDNLEIGGVTYKNSGVDYFTDLLTLTPVNLTKKAYSLQVGYPFKPFTGKEFTTRQPLALAHYQGKYVYVDFWGTWCKGCVADMPAMKKTYQSLDKTQFEFIGIVADSPKPLRKFIDKEKIAWPQILSDSANKLIESYHVTGFPTSVLLGPDGIVLARNLRGDALTTALKKLQR